jgi:UDP-4-amino-4,6-dideoxy-N-acetyl-beta-L-altrosamine transaminase
MIPYGKHHIDEEDIQAVVDVLRGGMLTQGPAIEAFEQAVATYVGAKYAVAVSSGTAALHLSALAAGAGPGKNTITSPITFVASANAGLYAGGDVTFADIDPHTINMSPLALEERLEQCPGTKVVIPVHFAGLPCEISAIKTLADAAGALVIEDAAHALGAQYGDGRKVGCCSHSVMTVFSFHPVKAIAAGEGGMITTNDEAVYRSLLRLRSHGINKLDDPFVQIQQAHTNGDPNPWYYEVQQLGFHYRITDIQCALALSQFRKLDQFIARRAALANRYDMAFENFRHCRPAQTAGGRYSGHHIYVVRIEFDAIRCSRSKLMTELRQRGIGTQVHYIPVPAHPLYRQLGHVPEQYFNAQAYYAEALTLPLFYGLSNDQQDTVVAVLAELVG